EAFVKKHGYSAVRDLVGHGVGYFAHEEPNVFNYQISQDDPDNIVLEPGMVIAIEPMINAGRFNVKITKNGYTFVTSDSSWSAHFEHSVAILEKGNLVLTSL
ncbi:MAG: M24 family metallopeptidase, partial [Patescibacteria group bacterium]|nr:M24 family metallopeptidase [Patescibacteria group bacterium]